MANRLAVTHAWSSPDPSEDGTLIRTLISGAAENGADLVHVPEGSLSGFIVSQISDLSQVNWLDKGISSIVYTDIDLCLTGYAPGGSPMNLMCLRHGLTPSNETHRYNGMSQEGITAEQRETLSNVAFDSTNFDVIYCSHLNRTHETALALGIRTWRVDPRLAERNLGIFEGLTDAECQVEHEEAYRSFRKFDADYVIPNGESRNQHWQRISEWLEEVSNRHNRVLAITHGGTTDFLYRVGKGLPLHGGDEICGGPNVSFCRFDVEWPRVKLIDAHIPLIEDVAT